MKKISLILCLCICLLACSCTKKVEPTNAEESPVISSEFSLSPDEPGETSETTNATFNITPDASETSTSETSTVNTSGSFTSGTVGVAAPYMSRADYLNIIPVNDRGTVTVYPFAKDPNNYALIERPGYFDYSEEHELIGCVYLDLIDGNTLKIFINETGEEVEVQLAGINGYPTSVSMPNCWDVERTYIEETFSTCVLYLEILSGDNDTGLYGNIWYDMDGEQLYLLQENLLLEGYVEPDTTATSYTYYPWFIQYPNLYPAE